MDETKPRNSREDAAPVEPVEGGIVVMGDDADENGHVEQEQEVDSLSAKAETEEEDSGSLSLSSINVFCLDRSDAADH